MRTRLLHVRRSRRDVAAVGYVGSRSPRRAYARSSLSSRACQHLVHALGDRTSRSVAVGEHDDGVAEVWDDPQLSLDSGFPTAVADDPHAVANLLLEPVPVSG